VYREKRDKETTDDAKYCFGECEFLKLFEERVFG